MIESAVSCWVSAPMSRPQGPCDRSSASSAHTRLEQPLAPALLVAARAERADVEASPASAPISAGSSNLSSWVRTTIAVWWSGATSASASSGHASSELVCRGNPLGRQERRARIGDDRRPAEQLCRTAERLRGVDRAVDEQARRGPVPLREHLRPVVELEQLVAPSTHDLVEVCKGLRGARHRWSRRPRRRAPCRPRARLRRP